MNENHAKLCPSPQWAAYIQNELLPDLTSDVPLGGEMLEVGPGPGAATEWLRHKVSRLVALEVDRQAADRLAAQYAGSNVEVILGDAARMDLADASFDSVGTFTMLHHVATAALQDRVLSEAFRVLRPGGVLIGSDSLASNELHHFHVADTYNPIEPSALLTRLQTLGFAAITIVVDGVLKFIARKPASEPDGAEHAGGPQATAGRDNGKAPSL